MNALTILSGEQQTWSYYMNIGPLFSDPLARQQSARKQEEDHLKIIRQWYERMILENEAVPIAA
jgi:hypothetical protein